MPHLHLARGEDAEDEVQPNVGEDAPGGRNEKYPQVFDLARLAIRHHVDAQRDDDEHVEGSTAHDGARAQRACREVVTAHLQRKRMFAPIQWLKNPG